MKLLLKSSLVLSLTIGCFTVTEATVENDVDAISENSSKVASSKNGTSSSKGTKFKFFYGHDDTMTCTADAHATPFNQQIRGVNLGGWMVLEPWITPSMFYQFLGGNEDNTAMDMYSFCDVLGPKEGNKQLHRHWKTWVTKDIIQQLAESGAVNSLRLPVGDFQYVPYGPYKGCVDGSLEYIDYLIDWAHEFGLTILLDVHTATGSQNGFDNSGQTLGFTWTSNLNSERGGLTSFQHWPIRNAAWMGTFNTQNVSYDNINYDNIQHSLKVVEAIVKRYSGHPAILGLEPLNEPWQYTPIGELKRFYWEGYKIVKRHAPYWKYIMHDSFRFTEDVWGGFMAGCPDRALDTHIYQAWNEPGSRIAFYNNACSQKHAIAKMEQAFGPVIVGEWSLATDNCAMWLNGFNDNLPGFPRLPCKYIPCSDPYMGIDQPGTPVDPGKAMQGPFGTGMSSPIYGQCPVDRDWIRESSGNPTTGEDWIRAPPEAPQHRDDTDNVMHHLALKKINTFSITGHGFYFWNFRTDLYEPHWSYLLALERGWIPNGNLNDDSIMNACYKEDQGEFLCLTWENALEDSVRTSLEYVFQTEGKDSSSLYNMSHDDLFKVADDVFDKFWNKHRGEGATCDFGGVARLVLLNRTTDQEYDDDLYKSEFDDDFYVRIEYVGPNYTLIVVAVLVTSLLAGCVGFTCAMRMNKRFNKRVRSSAFFNKLPGSQSNLVRSGLSINDNLYDLQYEPVNEQKADF